jgi:hypothetical protein
MCRTATSQSRCCKHLGLATHSLKHFSRLLRLATLEPDIVAAIMDGKQLAQLSRTAMLAAPDVPLDWGGQRMALGCARA